MNDDDEREDLEEEVEESEETEEESEEESEAEPKAETKEEPRPPTMEERRKAALEFLRENPDAIRDLVPSSEASEIPEFTSFEELARWAKSEAVKEVSQTLGVRAQTAATVQAELDAQFGDELTAAQKANIVAMFNDPNATPDQVRAAYAQGVHIQFGKAAAYESVKGRKTMKTSAEPVGGGQRSAPSADVQRVIDSYSRMGLKLSRKEAEEFIRSGGSV